MSDTLPSAAFWRLFHLMALAYGEEGFLDAPPFVRDALNYAMSIATGAQWTPPGVDTTPEEATILARHGLMSAPVGGPSAAEGNVQHAAECRWERTTPDECEYRETHEYCPHPEHACDCMPVAVIRGSDWRQLVDHRTIASLRADRDRLERERNEEADLRVTYSEYSERLERELEAARTFLACGGLSSTFDDWRQRRPAPDTEREAEREGSDGPDQRP